MGPEVPLKKCCHLVIKMCLEPGRQPCENFNKMLYDKLLTFKPEKLIVANRMELNNSVHRCVFYSSSVAFHPESLYDFVSKFVKDNAPVNVENNEPNTWPREIWCSKVTKQQDSTVHVTAHDLNPLTFGVSSCEVY